MLSNDFDHPRVWCPECKTEHGGEYMTEANTLYLQVDCPRSPCRHQVSTDAALFYQLRKKQHAAPVSAQTVPQIYYLHLTDCCSLACPVCFARATPGNENHMALADLRNRAAAIRRNGGHFVTLTGGEPTEHPAFLEIIRLLRRTFRLQPSAITNGIRLAEDASFATACKKAGLNKIHLSFDTFNPETSCVMRGRDLIAIKQTAIENLHRAELAFSLIMTVCETNLHEVGDVIRFAAGHAPLNNLLVFQPLQKTGRVAGGLTGVDRETILHAIAGSGAIPELTPGGFLPTPMLPMIGACPHPDCAAILPLTARGNTLRPWGNEPGFSGLLDELATLPPAGRWRTRWRFLHALRRHTGWRGIMRVMNWTKARKGESCFLLMVDNLMAPECRDLSRLERCCIQRCEVDGTMRPVCASYDETETAL